MQIKIFTVPITDNGSAVQELNTFLKNHKVIECIQEFANSSNGSNWCFCVKYIEQQNSNINAEQKNRKDYKQELDDVTFQAFTLLRDVRKSIAAEDKVPAYAVCTDAELSMMAKLPELTKTGMLSVKGFGEKKFEKYGTRIIEYWSKTNKNEADRESV